MADLIIQITRVNGQVQFTPHTASVAAGADIYWRNGDTEAHWPAPSAANPTEWLDYKIPGTVKGAEPAVSPGISIAGSGQFNYICAVHPHAATEKGVIIIPNPTGGG